MLLGSSFLYGLLALANRNISSTGLGKKNHNRQLKGWGGGESQEKAFAAFGRDCSVS